MGRTRPDQSREDKMDEILAAAEQQLRLGGYQALSVAAIARQLGLAQNAIYWYFPSKDELFVATLRRMLAAISAGKPSSSVGDVERVLWFTEQFHALSDLRGAMSERARSSPTVAAFVDELDGLLSRMLAGALAGHVRAPDLPIAVEAFRATVEGTFVKDLDQASRRRVLGFALRQIMGEQDGGGAAQSRRVERPAGQQ
ncbi:MAG: TetR family transcriptional regulator [Solirubrobacterales bacterium]|jgi:AcrR family transcriptional regulator|nr:TetR family transcriptional regulator [Solirubrobacterales bacterium]